MAFGGGSDAQATVSSGEPGAGAQYSNTVSNLSTTEEADLRILSESTDQQTSTFDADLALAKGATTDGVADWAAVLSATGFTVSGDAGTSKLVTEEITNTLMACTGANGYTGHWVPWGHQVALDSCNTGVLINLIYGTGGGTAAIGGLLTSLGVPAGPAVAAVGGIVAAGGFFFAACQNASSLDAIYVNFGGVPNVSCWGQ